MTLKTNKTLRGFSIIELTIVIILIGLLSIAILTGTQLIKEAQIRSLIESITQYEKAVREFKVIYNYLPGDFPHVETWPEIDVAETCYRIDKNGHVNGVDGKNVPDYALIRGLGNGDLYKSNATNIANCHLVLAGILPKQENVGRGILEKEMAINATKREYTNSYFIDRISIIALASLDKSHNDAIVLGAQPQRIPPETPFNYISAKYAAAFHTHIKSYILQAVDRKMDDGKPGDGKVIFATVEGSYPGGGSLDTGIYNLGDNGYDSYEQFCDDRTDLGVCTQNSVFSYPGSKNLNSAYLIYRPSWLNS